MTRDEIMAKADQLYFSGGYRTINRGMLGRILREIEEHERESHDTTGRTPD